MPDDARDQGRADDDAEGAEQRDEMEDLDVTEQQAQDVRGGRKRGGDVTEEQK